MKINSTNILARWYQWIYGYLPNSICPFFWGTLFSLFAVPGRLLKYIFKKAHIVNLIVLFYLFAVLVIPAFVSLKFALYQLLVILFVFIVQISIIGVILLFSKLINFFQKKERKETSKDVKEIRESIIAVILNKYCTKITWI